MNFTATANSKLDLIGNNLAVLYVNSKNCFDSWVSDVDIKLLSVSVTSQLNDATYSSCSLTVGNAGYPIFYFNNDNHTGHAENYSTYVNLPNVIIPRNTKFQWNILSDGSTHYFVLFFKYYESVNTVIPMEESNKCYTLLDMIRGEVNG